MTKTQKTQPLRYCKNSGTITATKGLQAKVANMYFANMYCYGSDQNIVGITGIVGCMGVVYVANGRLYALHIPHNSDELNKNARVQFAAYVKNNEAAVGKGQGYLFGFINGTNRTDAEKEMKDMKKRLNGPPTTVYRINKHLGPKSGTFLAESVAVLIERFHVSPTNPSGVITWYKQHSLITYVNGGTNEFAQYKIDARYQGDKVPSELNSHWWRVNEDNCKVTKI